MVTSPVVSKLGHDEYRITFPRPVKFDMNLFLLAGTHKIRLVSPNEDREKVIAIEGEKETLLDWLRSIGGITEEAIKSYEDAMSD